LDRALEDVSFQLGELRDSLSGYSANLFSLTVSLNRLNEEVTVVADSMSELQGQIDATRELVAGYRVTASDAGAVIADASERLSGQVWLVRIIGVLLLVLLVPAFSAVWWAGRSNAPRTPLGELTAGR
jgi:hypothetical protein